MYWRIFFYCVTCLTRSHVCLPNNALQASVFALVWLMKTSCCSVGLTSVMRYSGIRWVFVPLSQVCLLLRGNWLCCVYPEHHPSVDVLGYCYEANREDPAEVLFCSAPPGDGLVWYYPDRNTQHQTDRVRALVCFWGFFCTYTHTPKYGI